IITEIISDPAWAPNNAINLFISGGSSERRFHSYNSNIPFSPRLVMVVAGGAEPDVRQRLLQLVNEQLFTLNRTPTVETLYEAANYWRGDEVYYGRHRGQGGFPNGITNPNDLDAFHIHDDGGAKDNNTIAKDGSLDTDPD
ncbi:MAG TPA: hypothetical protein DCF45_09675, partial [Gammaproteobacteria bacterium]|nr:hypothetical protein [Gammaproteobacteria bacterium]